MDHPTRPQLSFFCQWCAVSPPQQIMCGVPTPIRYVRCPHLNKVGAASPPSSIYFFCAVSPPFATLGSVLDSISKAENLTSSRLQDEATDCFFMRYLDPIELSIYLNLYLRVWHSQLSLFFHFYQTSFTPLGIPTLIVLRVSGVVGHNGENKSVFPAK